MASPPNCSVGHHRRPVPCPSNPVLLETQAKWLFTDEELTRSPSQLDGMRMEAEHTSRCKGVNFITQVGIMLRLPQLTIATAAVYLQRFFMRYSMVDIPQRAGMHPYPAAATSLFLATKVEENVRKMREFVVACCRVGQKQPNLVVDEQSKEFWKWRDTILHHEDLLLEALCFDIQLEQPYRILYEFLCFFGVSENKPMRNASWAFVNDSMYTVLCLQFTARTIAASALYAAAMHCGIGFEDDDAGQVWWKQIDVDLPTVRRACTRLAELYENNAMQRHSQHYPTTSIPSGDGLSEKTRIARAGVVVEPMKEGGDESGSQNAPNQASWNGPGIEWTSAAPTSTLLQLDAAAGRSTKSYSPSVREGSDVNSRKRSRKPEEGEKVEDAWRISRHDQTTGSWNVSDSWDGGGWGGGGRSPKRSRTAEGDYGSATWHHSSYHRGRDRYGTNGGGGRRRSKSSSRRSYDYDRDWHYRDRGHSRDSYKPRYHHHLHHHHHSDGRPSSKTPDERPSYDDNNYDDSRYHSHSHRSPDHRDRSGHPRDSSQYKWKRREEDAKRKESEAGYGSEEGELL